MNGRAAGAGVGTAEEEEAEGSGAGGGLGGTLTLCWLDTALLAPSLWSLSEAIVSRTCLNLSTDADFGNTRWVSA